MLAQWTGELVGKMHIYGISAKELAEEAGWNPKYLSCVINGKKNPKNAETHLAACLNRIIAEKQEDE